MTPVPREPTAVSVITRSGLLPKLSALASRYEGCCRYAGSRAAHEGGGYNTFKARFLTSSVSEPSGLALLAIGLLLACPIAVRTARKA